MATKKIPPLTDKDGDVRELTADDLKNARSADEAIPGITDDMRELKRRRGPQKEPTKERITIRLDAEVVEHYKAKGKGWQTELNEDLRVLVRREEGAVRARNIRAKKTELAKKVAAAKRPAGPPKRPGHKAPVKSRYLGTKKKRAK